jgi:Xaa-Pro aminopeptidase
VSLSDLTNFNYPQNLQADTVSVPAALWQYWQDKKIDVQQIADPCYMPRTLKNPVELAGAVQAHVYDGVAVTKFLYWFAQQHVRTDLTECDVVDKLQNFRAQQIGYYSDSFATIAGSGPNGAIVHYKPEPATCRTLQPNELLLLDSGAQYNNANFCGTTDITRVLWFGQNAPTAQAKNYYTMVLKAHIGAASAVFPVGTCGAQIDALARAPLWACGQNFGHGLGHGVGSFASVHDGAVGLSPKSQGVLVPHLLITIEPGIYIENTLGVRLENVYQVVAHAQYAGMLVFESFTLVPFDNALIDVAQLTPAEKTWLNNYHAQVLATLAPLLEGAELVWLKQACAAI